MVAAEVREHRRVGTDRAAKAPEQAKQVDVGDRIRPDRPLVPAQPLFRDPIHRLRVLGTLLAGGMQGGGGERHPRDDMRLGVQVAVRKQLRRRIALCEVVQDGGNLGQRASADHQRGHLALWVQAAKFRRILVAIGEADRLALERRADFMQGDMNRQGTAAGGMVEDHWGHSFPFVAEQKPIGGLRPWPLE